MAGKEIEPALDKHLDWGITRLDLKEQLFGKLIQDLDEAEALRLKDLVDQRGMKVDCLSSTIFAMHVEDGEPAFRERYEPALERLLKTAEILEARTVRLLDAQTYKRGELLNVMPYLKAEHSWIFDLYREAIDRFSEKGFPVVIENEIHHCIFSSVEEIVDFFTHLDRRGKVSMIWDIQNLWETGTFPSLAVYEILKPWIGAVHVKGGYTNLPGSRMTAASSLRDASWPVLDICRTVVADGVSPVLCLNPSHGIRPPGWSYDPRTDLDYLRENLNVIP